MYKIEHVNGNQFSNVKIVNTKTKSFAKIVLNEGASLQELSINNTAIIEDLSPLRYDDVYASSILFPFANRIKDGVYNYEGTTYQFEINLKVEHNALHGLVYNKTFKILDETVSEHKASITLGYEELKNSKGFPYTYNIQLIYTLTENELNLNVIVKNTDSKAFPFTMGWHPYFTSEDLYKSCLKFDSNKKLSLDERMITTGVEDYNHNEAFEIKDKKLDDCFILNSITITFETPSYDLEMTASSNETFLQIFTPPRANTIAIEPTTGVSDSFNNKIGLQVLESGESYRVNWGIKITTK